MGHYDSAYEYDDARRQEKQQQKYAELLKSAEDVFDKLDKIAVRMSADTDRELVEAETRKLRALYYFCLRSV